MRNVNRARWRNFTARPTHQEQNPWWRKWRGGYMAGPVCPSDLGAPLRATCQEHLDSSACQDDPDSMTTTPEVQEGLAAIAKAIADIEASERALRFLVTSTKLQGATWQQIGDVFGISRQSAQERFGKEL